MQPPLVVAVGVLVAGGVVGVRVGVEVAPMTAVGVRVGVLVASGAVGVRVGVDVAAGGADMLSLKGLSTGAQVDVFGGVSGGVASGGGK